MATATREFARAWRRRPQHARRAARAALKRAARRRDRCAARAALRTGAEVPRLPPVTGWEVC